MRNYRMLLCASLLLLFSVVVVSVLLPADRIRKESPLEKAIPEIRGTDMALTRLASDTHVKDLHDLFIDPSDLVRPTLLETISRQTGVIYELLKKGRGADIGLKPEMKQKLGTSYMDIGLDPWKKAYQFYLGPLDCPVNLIPFRSFRGESYVYDKAAYELESVKFNLPIPEADIPPAEGFPAPKDLPVYIFSTGKDKRINQPFAPDYDSLKPDHRGGGDDINNWDNQSGWSGFY